MSITAAVLLCGASATTLSLPSIFSSSMVLQHGEHTSLWGIARPQEHVTVSFAGEIFQSTASASSGRWDIELPPLQPSLSPLTMHISAASGESITLVDIVIGTVILCSGQSNMGLAVVNSLNASAELAAAGSQGHVRMMQVKLAQAMCNVSVPQTNLTVDIPWARPVPPHSQLSLSGKPYVAIPPTNFSAQC